MVALDHPESDLLVCGVFGTLEAARTWCVTDGTDPDGLVHPEAPFRETDGGTGYRVDLADGGTLFITRWYVRG